jgi:AcrR family transcriptional regulator
MKDDDGKGLPASVQAAWGLRLRPARGPKPGLSLDRIVEAAVRVAAAEGLQAVSMSRVAAEVDATAMALYRYVGNKDELLALMVDASIGLPPEPADPDQNWRAGLSAWAWAQLAAFRRHSWGLRLPIGGLPTLPNQVTWLDHGLRCLARTGLTEENKLSVILLVSNLVRVYAQVELDLSSNPQFAGQSPDAMVAAFGQAMALLMDPVRFPALTAALASGALDTGDPMDKEFGFGLERVLDGIDVLIARPGSE